MRKLQIEDAEVMRISIQQEIERGEESRWVMPLTLQIREYWLAERHSKCMQTPSSHSPRPHYRKAQ